jgi:formate--tetrahydrofolate ligase
LGKRGRRTRKLAKAVEAIVEHKATQYKPLYDWKLPIKDKIEVIAKEIYDADRVVCENKAELNLKRRVGL